MSTDRPTLDRPLHFFGVRVSALATVGKVAEDSRSRVQGELAFRQFCG